ncbi:hypothetical protein [Leptospira noguchii]|uniref:Uncharacterized protein n=1 Tax=Leptospira noguchii str. 2007001578 TaxID=1049974 RepID=A0ABP2T2K5_9LEPT|nr:hypothetical protein [Leptospira noguchii]EMM98545.1 hypothetical protein LEP1GSC035_0193 [Leptospira noguchii str. 2007001578]
MVFGLASVLELQGYYCFLEVPFYNNEETKAEGRYDLVTLANDLSSLLIIEGKSDKDNWEEAISNDFQRLQNFKVSNFSYLTDKDIYIFSFHWTEDTAKRHRFKNRDEFGFGRISFEWRMIQKIIFESSYNQKYFILGIGSKL